MHGLHPRSPKVVKLVHGLHHGSPRVVELEVGLHHGCPGSDHRSPGVVEAKEVQLREVEALKATAEVELVAT